MANETYIYPSSFVLLLRAVKDQLEDRCDGGWDNIEYGGVGAVPDGSVPSVTQTDAGKMHRCVEDVLKRYACAHRTDVVEVGAREVRRYGGLLRLPTGGRHRLSTDGGGVVSEGGVGTRGD